MAALPFVTNKEIQPTHVVYEPWYKHPPSIRCRCGMTMYPRVRQDEANFMTKFECGDWKCQKCIIFIDMPSEVGDNSKDTPPSRS